MSDRLIKCHEACGRLSVALKAAIEELRPTADPRVINAPHLIGLKAEVETFLYESKNFLRDLLGVINIFFGTAFDEASAFYDATGKGNGKLVRWARATFGATEPFTAMLISEEDWIGELIRKRNAIEHPDGKSGTLQVVNFEPIQDGRCVPPNWYRDQNPPTAIFDDLETYLDNLLTLAEEMLVSCIVHNTLFKMIQFVEIPEKDRDPNSPTRITVTRNHSAVAPPVSAEVRQPPVTP